MAVGSAIGAVLAARVADDVDAAARRHPAQLRRRRRRARRHSAARSTRPCRTTGVEATIHQIETFVGVFVGAVTFTGSVVAFGKLQGVIGSKPLLLPAPPPAQPRHGGGVRLSSAASSSARPDAWRRCCSTTVVAGVLGIHLVMAIGGADMPVVVSMLNSYSGWAAAAAGLHARTTTCSSSPARWSARAARSSATSCARR